MITCSFHPQLTIGVDRLSREKGRLLDHRPRLAFVFFTHSRYVASDD
jgi:hypothetical protein